MRLRTKLFLSIGALLLGLSLVMLGLSEYFVTRDVGLTADDVHGLIQKDRKELRANQTVWFRKHIERLGEKIETLLFLIEESPSLSAGFLSQAADKVWEAVATVASYNPEVGLVQVTDGLTAVIVPGDGELYEAEAVEGGVEVAGQTFHAVPLEKGFVALASVKEDVEKIVKEEKDLPVAAPFRLNPEAQVADKLALIEMLAPLVGRGLEIAPGEKVLMPEGMVRFNEKGRGVGILTGEIFRRTPLGEGQFLYDGRSQEIFLADSLQLKGRTVTVGIPLGAHMQQLAAIADLTLLFSDGKGEWIGFGPDGERIEDTAALVEGGKLEEVPLTERANLYIYASGERERAILAAIKQLDRNLTTRFTLQMVVVFLASIGVALLFLGRIATSITRPVTELAKATEEVAKGNYSEIELPQAKGEIGVLIASFGEMVEGLEEREKIRGVLDKVVSKDVAEEILKNQVHLGGEEREVTMLFSDIRGFTHLSEDLPPQELIHLLNEYMTKMSHVIEGEGGVIDKYVGDEIMALYGAPAAHPDQAIRALSTAMLMIETLKKWNETRVKEGKVAIEMGVGIHTGNVVAGNMGAEDRLNYTVVGANVNLASRLCQAASPMQILISEHTLKQPEVQDSFHVEELEPISLKGFSEPVKVFQITGFKWG